jgi:uncharacterized membrane protein YhaH (DUF805 family)
MNGKYLLYGTLAAGITLFVWQTISNVAIPWHSATMTEFKDNAAAVNAIQSIAPTNGMYYSRQGALVARSFTPDVADKSQAMGPNMAKQVVIDLVAALVLCIVVAQIGVRRKRDTAMQLALAGFAMVVIKELSDWNWYGFAASYEIVNIIDLTIQFALAGVVIAWIYKRQMRGDAVAAETPGVRAQGSYRAPSDSRMPVS